MVIFRVLNKVFGAILLSLLFAPLIALVAISKLLNFIDLLYHGKIGQAASIAYNTSPEDYKETQKKDIYSAWKIDFESLLGEKAMKDLINAGVDAWEPLTEPDSDRSCRG